MNSQITNKIFSGTALQIASRLIVTGITLVLYAVISRSYSQEDFGRLLFYIGLLNFLDIVVDFGISPAALSVISKNPLRTHATLLQARKERYPLAALGALCVPLIAYLYGDPLLYPAIFGALYLLTHPLALLGIRYQREIRYFPLMLTRIGGVFLTFIISLSLFAAGIEKWEFHLGSFALGWTFSNLILYFSMRKDEAGATATPTDSIRLLHLAWPLGIATIAQQLYFNSGSFFVRTLHGDSDLALYAVPHRGFVLALMFPSYLTATALPLLAASHGDKKAFLQLQNRLLKILLLLGIPVAALTMIFAPDILQWVFGARYEGAAGPLRALAVAGFGVTLGSVGMTSLVARERTRAVMTITLIVAGLSLVSNWIFVQRWGATGAAAANALCECTVGVVSLLVSRERL